MKQRQLITLLLFLIVSSISFSQSKRVLYIGNSYTGANNLPLIVKDLTISAGDQLEYYAFTPGGQTLEGHFSDINVHNKIAEGNWDYVVLQEQSQRPAFPDQQVAVEVFPYAYKLDSLIRAHNPCGETVFYMTWGRKNGDAANCAFWPPICTYSGMDSLLYLRYMQMAEDNDALVNPAGQVWHYIRDNHPEIELYSADGSHPSMAGSYATACSFYSIFFQKDPTFITNDYGLSAVEAANIRNAAKIISYDQSDRWFVGSYSPSADFNFTIENNTVNFTNTSNYSSNFEWDFGDGSTSSESNPSHSYATLGSFDIRLIAGNNCGDSLNDTLIQTITLSTNQLQDISAQTILLYPNPSSNLVNLKLEGSHEIILRNINGEILLQQEIKGNISIDMSTYPNGSYFLLVQGNNELIKSFKIEKL